MKTCFLVVGARPNFMKAAALYPELSKYFNVMLIHTGQHYDDNMSGIFFRDFNLDDLSFNIKFNLKSRGHALQTSEIMVNFDKICETFTPDLVVVVGDVNSTLACGLVAKKRGILLVHVEAGLRSFDQTMPEELNRVMVDHIADYLFATEPTAYINLENERVLGKCFCTGDVMIDTLMKHSLYEDDSMLVPYCVCTIHREKNITDKSILKTLLETINIIAVRYDVIFPIHPNTHTMIKNYGYSDLLLGDIHVMEPMPYVKFLSCIVHSKFVITDSGSLQTECNFMDIPCLVMRENTERNNAVENGCCKLVGFSSSLILDSVDKIRAGKWRKGNKLIIDDGSAAKRISEILNKELN